MLAVETQDYSKSGEFERDKDSPSSEPEPQDDALIEADPNAYEERFRVDRRKLEQMLRGDDTASDANAAEEFFLQVMESTKTHITWPSKLKIGAKSKKDPHIKVTGDPENVKAAKDWIMTVLDTKSNRVTLKMDVSHTEHSHVIGKGGANIKKVMQATGCHIHFPDSNRSSQTTEKSNQVSIAGSPLGVENARLQIRDLLPLVFMFELPVTTILQPDAEDMSSMVQRIQQMYSVSITFKQKPHIYLTIVIVRGTVGNAKAVREATSRLMEQLTNAAIGVVVVPVTLQVDIAPQHHILLIGRGGSNIKQIMQQTGASVHFPDPAASLGINGQLVPRPGTAYITGTVDSVYQARQLIIGCLPLVLMFDMKEELIVDQNQIGHLAEELDVFVSIKPKPKQPSRSVIVKSVERNARSIFEARRRLLGLTVDDEDGSNRREVVGGFTVNVTNNHGQRHDVVANRMLGGPDLFSQNALNMAIPTSYMQSRTGSKPTSPRESPTLVNKVTNRAEHPGTQGHAANQVSPLANSTMAVATATSPTWILPPTAALCSPLVIACCQPQTVVQSRSDRGLHSHRFATEQRLSGSWNVSSGNHHLTDNALPPRLLGATRCPHSSLTNIVTADGLSQGSHKTSSEIDIPSASQDGGLPTRDFKRLLVAVSSSESAPLRRLTTVRTTSPLAFDGSVPYQNGDVYRATEANEPVSSSDKRAPGAERAARKPPPPPPPGLIGPPNPTSVSDALADYERKKLLATKAIQQEPLGETRSPTDFWSGLGFSKSMPDSVIRDRLKQAAATRYLAPSMETTYESADGEVDRDPWKDSKMGGKVTPLPDDFLKRFEHYGLSHSNHLEASSPPPTHTSWSSAAPKATSLTSEAADLTTLLSSMGLGKYIDLFHHQEIDLSTFATLTDVDLKELGITTFGARRKMLLAIADLKKRPSFCPTPGGNNPFRSGGEGLLRRHDVASQSGRW